MGLLLLQRQRDLQITGVELHGPAAALADRAAEENALTDRLVTLRGDLRGIRTLLSSGCFDLCVSNPPYFPSGSGKSAPGAVRRTARSETDCTLSDVCRAAAYLLRWGGDFCLVHRPERLCDLVCTLRENGLEHKRLRMIEAVRGRAPSLLLLEAPRGESPVLREPPCVWLWRRAATAEINAPFPNKGENAMSGTLYLVAKPIGI